MRINDKARDRISYLSGLLAFGIYVVSMLFIYENEAISHVNLVWMALITVSAFLLVVCNLTVSDKKTVNRLLAVDVAFLIYQIVYTASTVSLALAIRHIPQLYSDVMWIITLLFVLYRHTFAGRLTAGSIKECFGRNGFYILISALFSLVLIMLSYDLYGPQFVWDANTFYSKLVNSDDLAVFNMRLLFFHGHLDFMYYYPIFLFARLFKSIRTAFFVYNAMMLTSASFGVVFLLKKTLPGIRRITLLIASAVILFSPFICGISTYYSYDYGLICLAPLLFLFAFDENWIWFFIFGFAISCTKETGAVFFAGICLGVLIPEMLDPDRDATSIMTSRKMISWVFLVALLYAVFIGYSGWMGGSVSLRGIIVSVAAAVAAYALMFVILKYRSRIFRPRVLIIAGIVLVCALAIMLIMFPGLYGSGDNGTGINVEHIVRTVRMYVFLNFQWLYILISVIAVICLKHTGKCPGRYILIYAVSALVFFLFNCVFVTYVNPRYMDAYPVCLLLIAVTLIISIVSDGPRLACLCILLAISAFSSFYSIDPVSNVIFNTADTGNGRIYLTDSAKEDHAYGGDQIIYNRQYYGLDPIINRAIKIAVDAHDDLIVISTGGDIQNWVMSCGRYSYDDVNEKRYFTEFWNPLYGAREPGYCYEYRFDPQLTEMEIRYVFPGDDIKKTLKEGNDFTYIYLPTQDGTRADTIRENFSITDEGSFSSHGWVLNYIRGTNI